MKRKKKYFVHKNPKTNDLLISLTSFDNAWYDSDGNMHKPDACIAVSFENGGIYHATALMFIVSNAVRETLWGYAMSLGQLNENQTILI